MIELDADYNLKGALTIGTQGVSSIVALDVDTKGNIYYGCNYHESPDPDHTLLTHWSLIRYSGVLGKVDGTTRTSIWV